MMRKQRDAAKAEVDQAIGNMGDAYAFIALLAYAPIPIEDAVRDNARAFLRTKGITSEHVTVGVMAPESEQTH